MSVTKNQIIVIQSIISKQGLRDMKDEMILQLTDGRTAHVSELTFNEADQLIKTLRIADGGSQQAAASSRQSKDRMVKHIFAMAFEMKWIEIVTVATDCGEVQFGKDYSRLHSWIEKYGYLKKKLNEYKYRELPVLVTQLKKVYADWLNK